MYKSLILISFIASFLGVDMAMAAQHGHAVPDGYGVVRIITLPGEAEISVNGQPKGSSPATGSETWGIMLLPGEYQFSATKDGYDAVTKKVFWFAIPWPRDF